MTNDLNEAAPDDKSNPADVIIALVRELVIELSPHRAESLRVGLESSLDRDLGLDSLARAELLLRLERTFKIHLHEEVLAEAETPRELLTAALKADGAHAIPSSTDILRPALSASWVSRAIALRGSRWAMASSSIWVRSSTIYRSPGKWEPKYSWDDDSKSSRSSNGAVQGFPSFPW